MNKKNIILLLSIIMMLIVSCEEKTESTVTIQKYPIRVGYMPDFSGSSAVAIAKEKGYFDEENLDVTLVEFLDGPSEVEEMLLKNLEFAYIGHGAHALAIEGKVNVLFPNGLSRSEQIIVRNASQIESIKDLRGKKVGTQLGTSSEILLYLALQSLGIKAEEVDIINMDGNTIVSSIADGTIDAASVQAPYTFEILNNTENNVKSIATTVDYSDVGSFPSSWIVTPSYQSNNTDIVNRFSRAILKAMDYRQLNMSEAVQLVANMNSKTVEEVDLERETGVWFSGNEIKQAYINGDAGKWYKTQQNIFIYTKTITNNIDINNYVQLKYMVDNVFNE
ncbi:ABC transporter substrate-binding protein [Brachyspira hyodysenteriae]|uniref:ABC transporter substrate-binding protein n=1 Tax=Brachyspira hyodysenteriae TaxID=159 RepID=UPI0005CA3D05|nr:ABC transporter substrate-binding protein [Brachyspira hyodysenteriae]KLI37770.1 nitrate ABC transporter [Brachyspira hyodysenteriae]KLI41642.1 nitrate ABC transporter [Brachyspira hyodysenteriae]KLI55899.1 nitrate ABC transporter [Brachyspira hyodysenteriae]MDA0079392.1 ABC transporter substrate-binding protein [Brachyspira hyodysenteriae]QTM07402.1 transporter substrate-binding domain-containing protein [Brachyspira hyodysenteriae]